MIDALIRRSLGTVGSSLLDFYLEYNFWINLALFAYVILILFARRNYLQVGRFIVADFILQHGEKLSKKSPNQIRAMLQRWNIPWEHGMKSGWFPFISFPQGLLLYFKSNRTFQKIFPIDVLVEMVVQQTSSRR